MERHATAMKQSPQQIKIESLAEAARLTGKSRTTIQRAIKSGKLSASRNEDGGYHIDPSELNRVFPLKLGGTHVQRGVHAHGTLRNSDVTDSETLEIKILQAELRSSQQMAEERGKTIEILRSELADEKNERRAIQTRLTALLTDQRNSPSQAPKERGKTHWLYVAAIGVSLLGLAYVASLSGKVFLNGSN